MKQRYEYRVMTGDLEKDINKMARACWRFVWAGHYDLMPYIVFEREVSDTDTETQ